MTAFTGSDTRILSDILYIAHTDILSPAAWLDILALIRQRIPFDVGGTIVFDSATGKPVKYAVSDVDSSLYSEYEEHYQKKDIFTPKALAKGMRVFRPTDVVSKSVWENSEFYKDFLAAHGLHHVLSAILGCGQELSIQLYLLRNESGAPFNRKDVQFLGLIQRHLSHALRSANILSETVQAKKALEAGLDQAAGAIFIFDRNGRLVHMNRQASKLCGGSVVCCETIPTAVQNIVSELLASKDNHPQPTIEKSHTSGNKSYRLTALLTQPPDSPPYCIVLAEEECRHSAD